MDVRPARKLPVAADAGARSVAVVGHVQPLVAVDADRAGTVDASKKVLRRWRGPGEQAERAVDVQPCAVRLGELGHRRDRIECP
jgi:hypothetical protein